MKEKLLSTKLELSTEMFVSGLEVSSKEAIPNLAGQHDDSGNWMVIWAVVGWSAPTLGGFSM